MLEILYRIYQVADEKTAKKNLEQDLEFGLYSSTSKAQNIELLMDCLICDNREQFKNIIRSEYGNDIPFRYSKKLKSGALYCIIIGERCYNGERYFNKVTFTCACCGAKVETYYGKSIYFTDYEVRHNFYGIEEYKGKKFCSAKCKQVYEEKESRNLKPDGDQEFYIQRDMFTENVAGYIYKITKKSTGQFYIGQTQYAPIFRWGQHLKTDRFNIKDILDYQFETIYIVPKGENILEIEKQFIKEYYNKYPELSLNIACITNEMKSGQIVLNTDLEAENETT